MTLRPELRQELLRRRDLDQALLHRMYGKRVDADLQERLDTCTRENTEWLRGVIRQWGWPGRLLVGEDGAVAAWLLAQHSDHDLAFQRECLNLLEVAVANGDAGKKYLAHLTDRVMVAERGTQIYGTQFTLGKHGPEPQPIEDPAAVERRRSEMGLAPLAAYRSLMWPVFVLPLGRMIVVSACRKGWAAARSLWSGARRAP